MSKNTEYQAEYCGIGGKLPGSSSKGGDSGMVIGCTKSEDLQPVGGRSQEKMRQAAASRKAAMASMYGLPGGTTHMRFDMPEGSTLAGLPVYDADFVATNYSAAEQGVHRAEPGWRDPRWTDPTRINSSTLYEQSERDPSHRNNFYVYRSTFVDPLHTGPAQPLAVPDVHKLRYMHGDYMSHDDWY